MNKRQLIIAWITGSVICLIILFSPVRYALRYVSDSGKGVTGRAFVAVKDWDFILPAALICLIIGILLIVTLRNDETAKKIRLTVAGFFQTQVAAISRFFAGTPAQNNPGLLILGWIAFAISLFAWWGHCIDFSYPVYNWREYPSQCFASIFLETTGMNIFTLIAFGAGIVAWKRHKSGGGKALTIFSAAVFLLSFLVLFLFSVLDTNSFRQPVISSTSGKANMLPEFDLASARPLTPEEEAEFKKEQEKQ